MTIRLVAPRCASLVALTVCGTLTIDYLRPSPTFCGWRSGCDVVQFSAYGSLAGVPLSLVGVVAFGLFYVLTLFPSCRPAGLLGPLSLAAAVLGAILLALQVWILQRVCRHCLVVDVVALALPLHLVLPGRVPAPGCRPRRWLWTAAALLALVGPLGWSAVKRPVAPVPQAVKDCWVPGKITVVEVTDFGCPHCRQAHPVVAEFVAGLGDAGHHVRLVRCRIRRDARAAARACLCAAARGKGEAMTAALFATGSFDSAVLERLGEEVGLERDWWRACLQDPGTDEQIEAVHDWLEANQLGRVPLVWVQDQLLPGDPTPEALQVAWKRAPRSTPLSPVTR